MSIQAAINRVLVIGAGVAKVGQMSATKELQNTLSEDNMQHIASATKGKRSPKFSPTPENTGIIATKAKAQEAVGLIEKGKKVEAREQRQAVRAAKKNEEALRKAQESLENAERERRWKELGGVL